MMRELKDVRSARRLSLLKGESGSGLVEYAIVFMVFMTMLLLIADFSRALYAYHYVSSAARDATRYAIVRGCSPVSVPDCPIAADQTSIQSFVQNAPLGIDGSKVTAIVTWIPDHKPGSVVKVEVDYPFTFAFPFPFWLGFGSPTLTTLNMKSTSQMVISQ